MKLRESTRKVEYFAASKKDFSIKASGKMFHKCDKTPHSYL